MADPMKCNHRFVLVRVDFSVELQAAGRIYKGEWISKCTECFKEITSGSSAYTSASAPDWWGKDVESKSKEPAESESV